MKGAHNTVSRPTFLRVIRTMKQSVLLQLAQLERHLVRIPLNTDVKALCPQSLGEWRNRRPTVPNLT